MLKGTLAVAYWYLLKVRERGAAELAWAPGSYKHEYSQDSPVWWVLDTGLLVTPRGPLGEVLDTGLLRQYSTVRSLWSQGFTLRLEFYKINGHINVSFTAQSHIVTVKIIAVACVPFPFTNIWIDSINNVFVRNNIIIIHNSICFESKPVCNGKLLIKANRIVCVGNIPSCHAIVAQAMHLRGKTIQSRMEALQLRCVIDGGFRDVIQHQLFAQLLPQPHINGTAGNKII